MGFGELFGKSWKDYKNNFKLILKAYWWLYAIPFVILFLFGIIVKDYLAGTGGLSGNIIIVLLNIVLVIGAFFLVYWFYLTLYYLSLYNEKGGMTFKQARRGGMTYFWRFLGLSIVLVLALFGLSLLLIIPGIIFSIYWMFSGYVLMRENTGVGESMKRSKIIVKGRWWRVFGNFFLLGIIIFLISLVYIIPNWLITIYSVSLIVSGGTSLVYYILSSINLVLQLVVSMITIPLLILFGKNLYLDLRTSVAKK